MGLCDTARASCRIKNTRILLSHHLLRYCKSTKYHSSYFAGWQAAVQGPTSLMVRGFASQVICKTSQHFPTERTEESSCPQGGPQDQWKPPLEEQGGCQRGRQQGPSRGCCGNGVALLSLHCLPFLQSSQHLYVPGSRETLLSMLIFMPGQIPFCAQII